MVPKSKKCVDVLTFSETSSHDKKSEISKGAKAQKGNFSLQVVIIG